MDKQPIPMRLWGKSHWSTLAYLETRCVDHGGKVERRHLRIDRKGEYPTRLNNGTTQAWHNDLDCIEDMRHAGLLKGSAHTAITLTRYGWELAAALRRHIAETRQSGTFDPNGASDTKTLVVVIEVRNGQAVVREKSAGVELAIVNRDKDSRNDSRPHEYYPSKVELPASPAQEARQ